MSYKTSITFTSSQLEYLRKEADRLGITISDLVRRIIDYYRSFDRGEKK